MFPRARGAVRGLLHGVGRVCETLGIPLSARKPWHTVLVECQDEITASAPASYYVKAYRDAEMYYWLPIPKWIRKDGSRGAEHKTLDIGCAYGTLAAYSKKVLGGQVCCTDRYPLGHFLTEERLRRYGFLFAVNDIELDPFPWDIRFDTVILTEVLEHFNFHPLPTLKKIRGLLSDGGKVYLSTPDASEWGRVTKYYARLAEIPYPGTVRQPPFVDDHVYLYTRDELMGLLEAAGFTVLRRKYAPGVRGSGRHFALTLKG